MSEPIDNLYLDVNGIIHNCVRQVYFENSETGDKNLERTLFYTIGNYINKLLYIVQPKKLVYIAIDGVAPMAKQTQQRQRRYKSSMTKTPEELAKFDSVCITPGTPFMRRLNEYFQYFIRKSMSSHPLWKNISVVFSSSNTPGEGEQKIINYIRSRNAMTESHCMYGLDADLFMLSLSVHMPKMFLLREDQRPGQSESDFFYEVRVHQLHDAIAARYPSKDPILVIDDFLVLCFLIGNDFVHAIPNCMYLDQALPELLDVYGLLDTDEYLYSTNGINLTALATLLEELIVNERVQLSKPMMLKVVPNKIVNMSISERTKRLNVKKYKRNYYAHAGMDSDTMCKMYLETLQWIGKYYHSVPTNWQWCYENHHAPIASDILDYILAHKPVDPIHTWVVEPISPYEQLLAVVPPRSQHLIPDYLLPLCQGPLRVYMPEKFEVEMDGKEQDWQGIALIPFVNIHLLVSEYKNLVQQLKATGRQVVDNYIPSKDVLFTHTLARQPDWQGKVGTISPMYILTTKI